MKKIEYSTNYADDSIINGYVMAEDEGEYYTISKQAYNKAIKNLTIGNTSPNFHADKPVLVIGIDIIR